MSKVTIITSKQNRKGQTMITFFGEVNVDVNGIAEIDEVNLEFALGMGFHVVPETGVIDTGVDGISSTSATDEDLSKVEVEQLTISLYKKKNFELEAILAEAGIPEEEYKGQIKKVLVQKILSL